MASYVDGKYAPINNAALTGTPVAPTAPAGTNSTQLATTAFVSSANLTMKGYVDGITGSLLDGLNLKANIASPSLTGVPQSITMPLTTANTSIATTQFVQNAVNEVVANLNAFTTNIIQQGNSKMEILDSGSGSANLAIDGINVLTATSSGVILRNGATAVTQLQTDNSTSVATTAYVRLAAKRWDGSAKFVSTDAPNPGINDVGSIDGDFWFQREA